MPRHSSSSHHGIDDDQPDYSPTQAADRLGFSRATAYNEIKAGRLLTFTNELGHWRVTHEEVERYRNEELPNSRARIGRGAHGARASSSSAERQVRRERGSWGGHTRAAHLPREELNRPMREGFRR